MVEDIETALISLNHQQPLSRLNYAHLELRETLYRIAIDPRNWPPAVVPYYRRSPPTIHVDGLAKAKLLWEGSDEMEMHSHPAHILPDEAVEYADVGRSFLPITRTKRKNLSRRFDSHHLISRLCLLPTGNQGFFPRIGMMKLGNGPCALLDDGRDAQRGMASQAYPARLGPLRYHDLGVGVGSYV